MRRALYNWLAAFFIIAVAPTAGAFAYYQYRYLPYQNDIELILATTHPQHQHPPPLFTKLLITLEGRERLYREVTEAFLKTYHISGLRLLFWDIDRMAWKQILKLHYDDREIIGLWCHFLQLDEYKGCESFALARFHKPLSALSQFETAELILYSRRPKYYRKNKDALRNDVKKTLHQL